MIPRNALLSMLVLMAGLIAGYFTFRITRDSPVFSWDEKAGNAWPGHAYSSDSAGQTFHGSSVELSHLYEGLKSDFPDLLEDSRRALEVSSIQRDLLRRSRDTATSGPDRYDWLLDSLEHQGDLLRLLDFYTRYFMYYYLWIESGDPQSSVNYKLAMGQFRATVASHQEKYREGPGPPGMDLGSMMGGTRIASQSGRTVRWARVVTVVLLFLLIMGIPRFIRDRGYRKFGASLYFDALFRPRKISDLNAWHSISRLSLILFLLYAFGGVILSSFSSWLVPLVLGTLGLLPVLFLTLIMGNGRRSAEILVSLMAPKVLILAMILGIVAVRGPMYFWYHFWVSETFRALFMAVFAMLIFHKLHVDIVLARQWSHRNRKGAASMVGMALSLQFLLCGIMLWVCGPEKCVLALNGELNLLPPGGSVSPGIASWLGESRGLPGRFLIFTGIFLTINLLVFLFNRRGADQVSPRSLA